MGVFMTYKLSETSDDSWIFSSDAYSAPLEELFYDALDDWHSGDLSLAEKKLCATLVQRPSHIDTLHHLSLMYQEMGRELESHVFNMAAVGAGLSAIPNGFAWGKSKIEWGFLENRPFLRAYHTQGLWLLEKGQYTDAIEVFTRILSASPNDNLGVRYLLPECWFALDSPEKVLAHCSQYRDDVGPEIQYSFALALVLLNKTGTAKDVMESAVADLPLVAKELLKKTHKRPASKFSDSITWGGADQAYEYWRRYGKYWVASGKAMQLLNDVYGKPTGAARGRRHAV
jgi:tetratricopeptide (TPR) repeat protein